MDDKYCYPGTDVLRNKLGTRNPQTLFEAEIEYTSKQLYALQEHPIKGNFDFKHLCRIHQFIFEDLYDWAGQPRTVDISKSGSSFCYAQFIQSSADDIFKSYYKDCCAVKDDKEKFVHTLTEHYGDLNVLHPFREGNGRTQREFARELCEHFGYEFDLTQTTHQQMLTASIASYYGDNSKLEAIFQQVITPIDDTHSKRVQQALQILSKDDIPSDKTDDYEYES